MSSTNRATDIGAFTKHQAVIALWVVAALAFLLLVARITGHFYQQRVRKFDATAWVVLASVVTLITRTILVHFILEYGTATTDPQAGASATVRAGTIMTLVVRVFLTAYYWLQTVLLLLFYKSTMDHIPWSHRLIQITWVVIVLTFVAVVLATFLECRPFHLYWDDSASCMRAFIQLQLQAACNILLDILLLVLSFPIAKAQIKLWPGNLQLGCLYALGFLCMIITGVRVAFIYRNNGVQHARSFWASIQLIVATLVANGPSIYGAFKVMLRRKKNELSLERMRSASLGGEWAGWREGGLVNDPVPPNMRGVG
jgi:hypothetical protein